MSRAPARQWLCLCRLRNNRAATGRQALEGRILSLLSEHLMEPELTAAFAEEYLAERNRLAARQNGDRAHHQAELSRVIKDQDRLVDAIM